MYCTDSKTGETIFALSTSSLAREVFLEGFAGHGTLLVPMRREARRWIARLALAPGWFFYRFTVDGRTQWDREAGKLKSEDGRPCSLALIKAPSVRRQKNPPATNRCQPE